MTDHPILFQPTMIEALHAGHKSQTRRLPNMTNTMIDGRGWQRGEIGQLDWGNAWLDNGPSPTGNAGPYLKVSNLESETIHRIYLRVQVGDRLWVREAHWALGHWQNTGELKKNGHPKWAFSQHHTEPVLFTDPDHSLRFPRDTTFGWYHRNSLFMRRKDCRMLLPVTNVRFQRLQEISPADSIAEGVKCSTCVKMGKSLCFHHGCLNSKTTFRNLINSINGPETWTENGWVIAYTFEAPTTP